MGNGSTCTRREAIMPLRNGDKVKPMIIAVDFDGTLAEHEFPDIGEEVADARGAQLILWTMRSDGQSHGAVLTQAVGWCRERGIEFHSVNCNPSQSSWTQSPKCYANIYVDDAASGCPLHENPRMGGRDFVDWEKLGPMVMALLNSK